MSVVHTEKAPKAIGPYSQAIEAGDIAMLACNHAFGFLARSMTSD